MKAYLKFGVVVLSGIVGGALWYQREVPENYVVRPQDITELVLAQQERGDTTFVGGNTAIVTNNHINYIGTGTLFREKWYTDLIATNIQTIVSNSISSYRYCHSYYTPTVNYRDIDTTDKFLWGTYSNIIVDRAINTGIGVDLSGEYFYNRTEKRSTSRFSGYCQIYTNNSTGYEWVISPYWSGVIYSGNFAIFSIDSLPWASTNNWTGSWTVSLPVIVRYGNIISNRLYDATIRTSDVTIGNVIIDNDMRLWDVVGALLGRSRYTAIPNSSVTNAHFGYSDTAYPIAYPNPFSVGDSVWRFAYNYLYWETNYTGTTNFSDKFITADGMVNKYGCGTVVTIPNEIVTNWWDDEIITNYYGPSVKFTPNSTIWRYQQSYTWMPTVVTTSLLNNVNTMMANINPMLMETPPKPNYTWMSWQCPAVSNYNQWTRIATSEVSIADAQSLLSIAPTIWTKVDQAPTAGNTLRIVSAPTRWIATAYVRFSEPVWFVPYSTNTPSKVDWYLRHTSQDRYDNCGLTNIWNATTNTWTRNYLSDWSTQGNPSTGIVYGIEANPTNTFTTINNGVVLGSLSYNMDEATIVTWWKFEHCTNTLETIP